MSGIVFSQVLLFAGPKVFAAQFQHGAQRVRGAWQCVSIHGRQVKLVIDKEYFDMNGERTAYSMVVGAIRVEGAYGPVNYYYNFRGDSLLIAFPDGDRIICERAQQEAQNHSEQAGDLSVQPLPDDETKSDDTHPGSAQ
ncbi:MAG: hypothetical protein KKC76_15440 [Proteobacteria bacterium]|nr:hypothetical protein [Pseudomonadota bacterium]MBU4294501.1 hypothetical protein [Pseudomonadota bacterium]MCG2747037.1 hypothetical protein [Desulfobulbaceae bacterium]